MSWFWALESLVVPVLCSLGSGARRGEGPPLLICLGLELLLQGAYCLVALGCTQSRKFLEVFLNAQGPSVINNSRIS